MSHFFIRTRGSFCSKFKNKLRTSETEQPATTQNFLVLIIKKCHTKFINIESFLFSFEIEGLGGPRKKLGRGGGGGQRKKQDRKIASLSLPLLYQYYV